MKIAEIGITPEPYIAYVSKFLIFEINWVLHSIIYIILFYVLQTLDYNRTQLKESTDFAGSKDRLRRQLLHMKFS